MILAGGSRPHCGPRAPKRSAALAFGILCALAAAGCVSGDTDPASDVRASRALLHAHGHTNEAPATYWWEYSSSEASVRNGTGTQICGSPPEPDRRCGPISSSTDIQLSQLVTSLSPNTTYYFRACAQDGGSPTCGRVLSFRTATVAGPGELLVADSAAFSQTRNSGGVIRVDPATGAQTIVSEGGWLVTPHGVTVDSAGRILVVDVNAFGGPGGVVRINPANGAQTVVSREGFFSTPVGIDVEADGDIVVADDDAFGGRGGVIRVDPNTGAQSIVSSGGAFVDPYGLGVRAGGAILVADQDAYPDGSGVCGGGFPQNGRGGVIRVDPVSGAQTKITSSGHLCDPDGAEVAPNGGFYIADLSAFASGHGGVICVVPDTGTQHAISQAGSFRQPADVAVAASGDLFVSDQDALTPPGGPDTGAVFHVDPISGAQTPVSSGGSFVRPEGIAVVPGLPPGPATGPCAR